MPQHTNVKPGTPSKDAENQDAATLTQSQPSTTEELQARTADATPEQRRHDVAEADLPRAAPERDPSLQPAAGPTGASDGDD